MQRLGTSIGDWRETFVSTRLINGTALRSGNAQATQDVLRVPNKIKSIGSQEAPTNQAASQFKKRFMDIGQAFIANT